MDLREEAVRKSTTRHPWEVARARFFLDLLRGRGVLSALHAVADVGAGDGYFARELRRALTAQLPSDIEVTCCDLHYTDDWLAARAADPDWVGLRFTRELPQSRTFDLLVLLDVLEHVADDRGFLTGLVAAHAGPGAHVLLSVPAWMALFSRHDLGVVHHRRYTPAGLREVARAAGLELVAHGGLFHGLLLPRALQKVGELARGIRARPTPEAPPEHAEQEIGGWSKGPLATALVCRALRADNAISGLAARAGLSLPGLSTWVLARRPGTPPVA